MKSANVLFICADEHARGALGCYGHPVAKTPMLDRLAGRGARFANAYTTSPLCVPARASMATGRYVHRIRCWDNGHPYHGVPKGWARLLREAGYRTVSIGKNHYRSVEDDNGFDEEMLPMHVRGGVGDLFGMLRKEGATYPSERVTEGAGRRGAPEAVVRGPAVMAEAAGPGESNHTEYDRRIAAAACRWLGGEALRHGDRPWALHVSFVAPHFPLIAPQRFFELYADAEIPWPTHYGPDERPRHPVVAAMTRIWNYDDYFDAPKVRRARAGYYGLVSFLDHNVGLLLRALEEGGTDRETVVIYTADHGEMLGNKGIWSTSALYEDSVAVPLVVAGPGVPCREVGTPVSHVDLLPTLCAVAGIGETAGADERPGRSLLEIARASPDPDRVVFSEYHAGASIAGCFMVRRGRWKYMHYVGYEPELFDLSRDPLESKDLGTDPAFADARRDCEAALRRICDPDRVNAEAFADQAAAVARHGGAAAVRRRGHPGEHAMDRPLGHE